MVFTAFFLMSCSSDQLRINKAFDLAQQTNFTPSITNTSRFPIQIFIQNQNTKHAIIYFEGDGLVINKYGDVALNPTPTDPMALRLAAVDIRPLTKLVVNRPFHYVIGDNSRHCEPYKGVAIHDIKGGLPQSRDALLRNDDVAKYWTTARYSPEVIQSIYEAIKQCQQKFRFETIELVAYSGGASVAFLLTPYLQNITRIVSFAGNLDHKNWTTYHHTQPLFESLDSMNHTEILSQISQIHFVGSSDDNTTIELAKAYKQQIDSDKISIIPVDGFDHDSNWPSIWREWLAGKKSVGIPAQAGMT